MDMVIVLQQLLEIVEDLEVAEVEVVVVMEAHLEEHQHKVLVQDILDMEELAEMVLQMGLVVQAAVVAELEQLDKALLLELQEMHLEMVEVVEMESVISLLDYSHGYLQLV